MNSIEQDNELAKAEAITRLRDRARVFREVFGTWDKLTPHGQIIIDALMAKFGHALPPNVLDNVGRTDPYQTWRRLGHFDVLEYIRTTLEWKEHVNSSSSSPQ